MPDQLHRLYEAITTRYGLSSYIRLQELAEPVVFLGFGTGDANDLVARARSASPTQPDGLAGGVRTVTPEALQAGESGTAVPV